MFCLPITAVLRTKNGLILRYIDGTQSPPTQVESIRQCELQPHEWGMVRMACNTTGWVTEHYYRSMVNA